MAFVAKNLGVVTQVVSKPEGHVLVCAESCRRISGLETLHAKDIRSVIGPAPAAFYAGYDRKKSTRGTRARLGPSVR